MHSVIGLSPKEYSRLVRFYRLYHRYVLEPGTGIMDLVVHFGYFDHVHLLKDFQFFLQTAPSRIPAAAIQADVRMIDQLIRVR
jgi:methylphosphotriester-DNA--protein-cysteine methyltransferase